MCAAPALTCRSFVKLNSVEPSIGPFKPTVITLNFHSYGRMRRPKELHLLAR